MITLIIVDPQYDFIDGGKLPIEGGKQALDNIVELINSGKVGNALVMYDWHPGNHCSFKYHPEHCVIDTDGARIYSPIIKAVDDKNLYTECIKKGFDRNVEELTAFVRVQNEFYDCVIFEISNDNAGYILSEREDVVVCGLGDGVLETLKQLVKKRNKLHSLSVFTNGIATEDNSGLRKYMIDNDVAEYEQ